MYLVARRRSRRHSCAARIYKSERSTHPCAAQIKKSEKNLLERLFSVIHHLTPVQMENLLREEDSVVQRRLQARKALNDVKASLYQVGMWLKRRRGRGTMPPSCLVLVDRGRQAPLWPHLSSGSQQSHLPPAFPAPPPRSR